MGKQDVLTMIGKSVKNEFEAALKNGTVKSVCFSLTVADVSLSESDRLVPYWLTPHRQGHISVKKVSLAKDTTLMGVLWLFGSFYNTS